MTKMPTQYVMAWITEYIDSSQVDAYIEAGYTVRFCRFYQFDKVCYLAMREEDEQLKKIILHLCADIGSDSKPYQDAGYDVRLIGRSIGVENYRPPEKVYGIIANPVCTEFSVASGFHKCGDYEKGMFLVNECLRIIKECSPVFWTIENPATGRLKDFLGKPVMTYEPWMFGSPWTKRTALWGKFNRPVPKFFKWQYVPKNPALYVRPGRTKPSMAFLHKSAKSHIREFDCFTVDDDMSFRSLCSQGFAQAFFAANK